MKRYTCPVCNAALSKTAYEKALGIVEERNRLLEADRAKVAKESDGLKQQLKQFQKKAAEAHEEGVHAERARNRRLLAGKDSRIQYLEDRLRQVETGATPQTDGLEF